MGASYPAGLTTIYGETLNISRVLTSLGMPGFETKQALIKSVSDFRLHINPSITAVLYYDASNAANSRYEAGSLARALTDRLPNGTGVAMDSAATGDRLYVCLSHQVGGLHLEMKTRNGNLSVLTVNYWNGAWTDTGVQDSTSKQGKTLNQDGDITFDKKTDWLATHLGGSNSNNMSIADLDAPGTLGFWLQLTFGSALSSDVEIANIWAINEDSATKESNHGYFEGGREYEFSFDRRNVGAIQAFLDEQDVEEVELQITWLRTTKE